MDFESFIQSLLAFVKNCDNVYFVLYALATCLATQIAKKLFVNKVAVDILHKFDIAVVLPFIFGAICSVVDIFVVRKICIFNFAVVTDIVVSTATIGALATVMFKLVSSLSGKSMKSILKDDVFGAFYTQLLYFGTVREKLLNKQLTLTEFINSVKLVCDNAKQIYQQNLSAEEKKTKLYELLKGIIDEQSIGACLSVLDKTLTALIKTK